MENIENIVGLTEKEKEQKLIDEREDKYKEIEKFLITAECNSLYAEYALERELILGKIRQEIKKRENWTNKVITEYSQLDVLIAVVPLYKKIKASLDKISQPWAKYLSEIMQEWIDWHQFRIENDVTWPSILSISWLWGVLYDIPAYSNIDKLKILLRELNIKWRFEEELKRLKYNKPAEIEEEVYDRSMLD